MINQTQRAIEDAELIITTALPAAGATANSVAIDLGQARVHPLNEAFDVTVSVPATPNLANTIAATFVLQESAEASANFTNIAELAVLTVTGTASGGAAASRTFKLPGDTLRYIRLSQSVGGSGGNNVAVSSTLKLEF